MKTKMAKILFQKAFANQLQALSDAPFSPSLTFPVRLRAPLDESHRVLGELLDGLNELGDLVHGGGGVRCEGLGVGLGERLGLVVGVGVFFSF